MRRLGLVLGMLVMLCGASVRPVQAQPNPLQGPQTITVVDAGACATAGACASFSLNNFTVGAIEVSGTFTGTLTPEVLVNTVWVPVTLYDGAGTPFTAITVPGAFSVANTGFARVRLRAGAFASGTATVYMRQGYFMAKLPGGGSRVLLPDGTAGAPALSFANDTTSGFFRYSSDGSVSFTKNGVDTYNITANGALFKLNSTTGFGWTATIGGGTADVILFRDATATLALRNGAIPQLFNIYTPGLAATSTAVGARIVNNTAATVGTPVQVSGRSTMCGAAYNSVSTLSETDCMWWELLPVSAAGPTSQTMRLGSSLNGGATVYPFTVQSNGAVTATQFSGNVLSQFVSVQNQLIAAPASAQLVIVRPDATVGSVLNVSALPTISSGFGTSPAVTAGSTPLAGSVNVGTGGVATSGIVLFNGTAFPSAPFCITIANQGGGVQLAGASTTQLNISTATAWPASTVVAWHCISPK